MIDLLQAFSARKIIRSGGKPWLVVYRVPGDGPPLAVVVECDEEGKVVLPAQVQLVMEELPP